MSSGSRGALGHAACCFGLSPSFGFCLDFPRVFSFRSLNIIFRGRSTVRVVTLLDFWLLDFGALALGLQEAQDNNYISVLRRRGCELSSRSRAL